MEHLCPIEYISIGEGAIDDLKKITEGYSGILLVADENTYAAAGNKVEAALLGKDVEKVIFGSEILIPDEAAIEKIEEYITDDIEIVVGIGSGVINDLCNPRHEGYTRGKTLL